MRTSHGVSWQCPWLMKPSHMCVVLGSLGKHSWSSPVVCGHCSGHQGDTSCGHCDGQVQEAVVLRGACLVVFDLGVHVLMLQFVRRWWWWFLASTLRICHPMLRSPGFWRTLADESSMLMLWMTMASILPCMLPPCIVGWQETLIKCPWLMVLPLLLMMTPRHLLIVMNR